MTISISNSYNIYFYISVVILAWVERLNNFIPKIIEIFNFDYRKDGLPVLISGIGVARF